MKASGQPIKVGGVKVGEIDTIDERDGQWIIKWHVTDVVAAQRAGLDVLGLMAGSITASVPMNEAADKLGEAIG